MNNPKETTQLRMPCAHLRNKEMYYQGQEEDAYSSGIFWCLLTHENVGPDGQPAGKKECCDGRGCFAG